MKENGNFEEWVHQRMQLFAHPSVADLAASHDRVLDNVQAGRGPLDSVFSKSSYWDAERPFKRIELAVVVAILLAIGGSAILLKTGWHPWIGSRGSMDRAVGDLRPQLPPSPLRQAVSVPPARTARRPLFEVAAIRQEPTPLTYVRFQASGERFTSEGTSLAALVRYAYNVASFQVIGGPAWVQDRDTQFRIQAKAEMPASTDEMREMLKSLLEERFQLKVIHQAEQTQGYLLQLDRNGPRFKKTDGLGPEGCFPFPARCTQTTMAGFAEYLSAVVFKMPVIDRTSLPGIFDLSVEWRPDSSQFGGNGGVGFFAGNSTAPSIFTAIKEQLGLTLEPGVVPIEMLLIDHAEKPSDN